jgi:hypothetical protein
LRRIVIDLHNALHDVTSEETSIRQEIENAIMALNTAAELLSPTPKPPPPRLRPRRG